MTKVTVCLAALVLAMGCKASVKADAKVGTGGEGEETADYDTPLDPEMAAQAAESPPPMSTEQALYGARQDLTYKGPATAKCECVSVALGQARDPAFEWATEAPNTDPNTQLTFALSTAGEACPKAPAGSLGPSYWGYQVSGNDVIVVVENAVEGRPMTTGAIIPKPIGDGQVYVGPLDKKVPYGRGPDGAARCKVGNPGQPRVDTGVQRQGGDLKMDGK